MSLTHRIGTAALSSVPAVTKMAVVVTKAVAPARKTTAARILVARESNKKASLSVSSVTNSAEAIAEKAAREGSTTSGHLPVSAAPGPSPTTERRP